ncbi:MAG: lipopolysaccharide heptosyltransferase II [Chthoniobacterales bacterium]|nr:lipopolysaccharide heptosyltransferase II [Chthoniobacterales bacterium]
MLDFSTYLLYRAGTAVVSLVPLGALFASGEFLGLCAWVLLPGYRRLATQNLAIAFAREKTPAELRSLTRRHFQRLGANLLCSLKIGAMSLQEVAECVTLENAEVVHALLRAQQPVVVALSHLGSWELFAQVFPKYFNYIPLSTVYQPLGNRRIDEDVRRKRARAGVEMFDRREGFQAAIARLRVGGVIGILSDQHAGDHGLWTPFFGRLASTTPLPGLLAKRTGAAVISASIYTAGRGRWRMVFTERFDQEGDSVQAITAKVNEVIAEQIRQAPEDWFWVHNRWKTPKPNFLLARYKRGVFVPPSVLPNALQPFRILIRGTNWLGDSVISAPAVRAIKQGRPDAHITVATPEKLAAIWKLIPEVDEVIGLPARSVFAVGRLLKHRPRFHAAILFPNSLRTALEVWFAGIPRRVGYRGHHRSWFLNQIVPDLPRLGPIQHQVHHYLHIAQHLGASDVGQRKAAVVSAHGAAFPLKLGLCPGAEYGPAKRWLPERFAEAAIAVAAQKPARWHLFGTAADAAIGQQIAARIGENCVNRIGLTSLEDLIAELRDCRLLLTNDTGTMHLATLLGVPAIAVFGSTEHRLTGPLGPRNMVIRHHVECSPCFLRVCPIDFRCMKAVTTEEVTAAVLAAL